MPAFSTISKETHITLGLLIIIVGAVFAFGMLFQKVEEVDKRVTRIEQKIDSLSNKYISYETSKR